MASFNKYKSTNVSGLLKHNNRTSDDIIHSNENIDSDRTIFNYHIKKGTPADVSKRLSEIFDTGRKDRNVLGEMIVTLPNDVQPQDEKAFFRSVYDFYSKEFGEENIINAVVHKDEKTPHIHIDFVPVIKSNLVFEKRNKHLLEAYKQEHAERIEQNNGMVERLCCDELINQLYLKKMHTNLSKFVTNALGYECGIINGATEHGNLSVLELKAKTLLQTIEAREKKLAILDKEAEAVTKICEACGITQNDIGIYPLLQRINNLEKQNRIYQNIIGKNRYAFSTEELTALKESRYYASLSSKLNIFDDNLYRIFGNKESDISAPDNSIVVIELYDRVERPLPQQKYIDSDLDLKRKVNMAVRINDGKRITVKSSQTSDKTFIFLRSDNEAQTALALLELKQLLKEQEENWRGRRIYMEIMQSDEENIARSILNKSTFDAILLSGKTHGDNDSVEREIQMN